MSEGRKPLGRLTVRNKNTGVETTIGTFWPLGDEGNMSLALGQSAYGERAELTVKQALDHLFTALGKKDSGCFVNCRMAANDKPRGERTQRRPAPAQEEAGEDLGW